MSFDVAADSYTRFMGQYSEPLGVVFADWAGVHPGQRAIDVGCGTGALTAVLIERLGLDAVAAVDPSAPFVESVAKRFPGVDVQLTGAETLPYPDDAFDLALAELVVNFMTDAVAGLREMARVTRPGGTVAACVWDFSTDRGPLATFWRAAQDLDSAAQGEAQTAGTQPGQLAELMDAAGLVDIQSSELTVRRRFATFDEWWQPYTLGVGPAGDYAASLDDAGRAALRARCAELLPAADFEVSATALAAKAVVAG